MRKITSCIAALALVGISSAQAAIVPTGLGSFGGATIEAFNDGLLVIAPSFTYGTGFSHLNIGGQSDYHRYTGNYGMGDEPDIINGGRGGPDDGYFGTGDTPTTFEFDFSALGGITEFGFYGAESAVTPPSLGRNGELDMDFLDAGSNLLGSVSVTTAGTFAWDQFHGFESTGAPIDRVRFQNVGHMVLDDVHFVSVPEPSTAVLLGFGLVGVGFSRCLAARRRHRQAGPSHQQLP